MVDIFKSKNLSIPKKLSVMVNSETVERIRKIEIEAEKNGNTFELNACVEHAILRLLKQAESQLEEVDLIEVEAIKGDIPTLISTQADY